MLNHVWHAYSLNVCAEFWSINISPTPLPLAVVFIRFGRYSHWKFQKGPKGSKFSSKKRKKERKKCENTHLNLKNLVSFLDNENGILIKIPLREQPLIF